MPFTEGFVGTVEVETRNRHRIWFSLTDQPNTDNWVRIGSHRAWFTMDLESELRPLFLAKLSLVMESLRHDLPIKVGHEAAAEFQRRNPEDSFEVNGVRILRGHMHF